MIKIIHTADNHLGIKYSSLGNDTASEKAFNERFDALESIVKYSNENNADYFIIAGDLFDTRNQPKKVIQRAVDVLKKCEAPIVVIPGNHDFYEGPESKLWKQFKDLIGTSEIHVLDQFKTYKIASGEFNIIFYPAFCQSKTSSENNVGWIERVDDDADAHIGIAHGNIEGLGLGADRYFNMTREELVAKKLDLWLLGHIHVPYPALSSFRREKILMPGTHSPDGFDRIRDGGFFDIQFINSEEIDVTFVRSGNLNFRKIERQVNSVDDVQKLKMKLNELNAEKTLLKLTLNGKLIASELEDLNSMIDEVRSSFLFFELDNNTVKKIEASDISRTFPENSLPFNILESLSDSTEDSINSLALEKGFELFNKFKQ